MAEGSGRIHGLLSQGLLVTSVITEMEVASALARRCWEGEFSAAERDRALAVLGRNLKAFFLVEATAAVRRRALSLLRRHPLRAAAALHLASCLEASRQLDLGARLIGFDARLDQAAAAEGLDVL